MTRRGRCVDVGRIWGLAEWTRWLDTSASRMFGMSGAEFEIAYESGLIERCGSASDLGSVLPLIRRLRAKERDRARTLADDKDAERGVDALFAQASAHPNGFAVGDLDPLKDRLNEPPRGEAECSTCGIESDENGRTYVRFDCPVHGTKDG